MFILGLIFILLVYSKWLLILEDVVGFIVFVLWYMMCKLFLGFGEGGCPLFGRALEDLVI
ncbi:hypothetical protein BWD162_013630 [Bartonella sp. WD16.2]|nr:hypothetical protein BWD162_013630 [Bartonella sp. WD16.2]